VSQIKFADELLLQFDQLNSELTDNAFRMGDLCVNVCDEYGHLYKHADILHAIADNTAACYDTLRARESVARAVCRQARLEYPLSFHQWRALVRKDTDPLPMADWALTGGKDGGIATVKEIYRHLGKDPDMPLWLRVFTNMQREAQCIITDNTAPAHVIEMCMDIVPVIPCPPMP
jgi:hypothetical protein